MHPSDATSPWGPPTQVKYPGVIQAKGSTLLPVLTDVAPAAAARPRDIVLVWKGEAERAVHVSLFDGLSFSGQAPIRESGTIGGPTVTALPDIAGTDPGTTRPGPTLVAWKGNLGDHTLHWTRLNSV